MCASPIRLRPRRRWPGRRWAAARASRRDRRLASGGIPVRQSARGWPTPKPPPTLPRAFPPARPLLAALLELNERIRRDFTFRPGVTTTSTTIREVLSRREGVCQDFTHLMIGALRGLGLPARYVSGYIRTHAPAGRARRLGADQSHAWVGCWLGPQHGWVDLDPTNGLVVKEEHVVLGWGRDFRDVTPLRGVILGGPEHELSVRVELEPQTAGT